jgi:hypothetical protein
MGSLPVSDTENFFVYRLLSENEFENELEMINAESRQKFRYLDNTTLVFRTQMQTPESGLSLVLKERDSKYLWRFGPEIFK